MGNEHLAARLRSTRWRWLWIGGTRAMAWGLVTALALVMVSVWFDLLWELSPQVRAAAPAIAAVAGAMIVAVLIVVTWRLAQFRRMAQCLDDAGNCRGEILTGYELGVAWWGNQPQHVAGRAMAGLPTEPQYALGDQPQRARREHLTHGLSQLALTRAANLATGVSPAQAVSARPLGKSLLALATLLAFVGLLAACLPALAATQWQRFSDPFGDVPPFSPITFDVEPGDVKVVYGRSLDIYATVRRDATIPVDEVELVTVDRQGAEEVLPMFPEKQDRWRAALAKVTHGGEYFVRAQRARSRRYRIDLVTVPKIEDVRFRVTPPAYTRDPIYEGPLPKDGIAGLPGTEVTVSATSNRPLSGGSLTVETKDSQSAIDMKPADSDPQTATGTFHVTANGKFRLTVTDIDGQSSLEAYSGSITALADERPFIRLLRPKPVSFATPTSLVPVEVAAEDDYGVLRVQIFRSLNQSRPLPFDIAVPEPPARRVVDVIYLKLADYALEPGDEIKVFARVEDNDPAAAKGSESSIATLKIISQEEFERLLRQRANLKMLMSKYRAAARRMESLANETKGLRKKVKDSDPKSKTDDELRKELRRLADRFRQEAAAIGRSADKQLPYDLDQNLTRHLRTLTKRLNDGADALEKLLKKADLSNEDLAGGLSDLVDEMSQQRAEFNREALEALEHLAKAFPLIADQNRFVRLVLRQRELAERLASLKGFDGEDSPAVKARMRDLEEEQRALRDELNSLLDEIESHATELPEDEVFDKLRKSALDFVAAVRGSGAAEAMAEAEAALAEFAGTRAHESAQRAAEILEQFLNQCQGVGEQAGQCLVFSPSLSNGLGNTIAQLLADMGLSSGAGTGGGSGFSAQRNGLQNVGLYGSIPELGAEGGSGAGDDNELTGDSTRSFAAGDNPDAASRNGGTDAGGASGRGLGDVPLEYRRRVGQYFERIADEIRD